MARLRTSVEAVTFRHPFNLKAVGQDLPPGTYKVVFKERELRSDGLSRWQKWGCYLDIPPNLLGPNQPAATKRVDHQDLERAFYEDQQERKKGA